MRTPWLLALLALSTGLRAQTETIDLATFAAPAGWKRTASDNSVMFEDRRRQAGRIEFCQIYLFRSQPAGTTAVEDFQKEWNAKIVQIVGIGQQAAPKVERSTDGWEVASAYVDSVKQGVPVRALLVVSSGFGKEVSVLVLVSPSAYGPELENFFKSLRLKPTPIGGPKPVEPPPAVNGVPMLGGPPSGSPPTGATAPAATGPLGYAYAVPNLWKRQEARDRTVLLSPLYQGGEQCQLTLLPMRPAARPLAEEAAGAYRAVFRTEPLTGDIYPPTKLERGMSPDGWEYFVIRKSIGPNSGMGTILLMAQSGSKMATVVATSKTPLVSNCFGELVRDQWPAFFYSLGLKNEQTAPQARAAIQQALTGTWITATATVGLRYAFLPNGRYAGAAGASQYRESLTGTGVVQTTQAYFGDGSYAFDGNTLVLTGDDHRVTRDYFRLQQVSKDFGRTWSPELCLLDPGATGEVCYRKE